VIHLPGRLSFAASALPNPIRHPMLKPSSRAIGFIKLTKPSASRLQVVSVGWLLASASERVNVIQRGLAGSWCAVLSARTIPIEIEGNIPFNQSEFSGSRCGFSSLSSSKPIIQGARPVHGQVTVK
jgi:hypothetical protein